MAVDYASIVGVIGALIQAIANLVGKDVADVMQDLHGSPVLNEPKKLKALVEEIESALPASEK